MEPVTTNNTGNKEIICQDRSFLPPYPFSSYLVSERKLFIVSYSICLAIESMSGGRERHHALEEALPEYQDGRKHRLICIVTESLASQR